MISDDNTEVCMPPTPILNGGRALRAQQVVEGVLHKQLAARGSLVAGPLPRHPLPCKVWGQQSAPRFE